ncbi:hypothetical protein FOA52_001124 [Chlamydomonas sp. UWO 241]|nr:hypothetical protein FOA52_001124 [Chlamydomonas sp. UWO 241]
MDIYGRITAGLAALGKRKEREDEDNGASGSALGSPAKQPHAPSYRPADQADLHRRLQTFKPLTWFGRPDIVSAVECATRGWANIERDMLVCDFCRCQLKYPASVPVDHRQAAAEAFAKQLVTQHATHCPWRKEHCERSLLYFQTPAGPEEVADHLAGFHRRAARLEQVDLLPDISPCVLTAVAAAPCFEGRDARLRALLLGAAGGSQAQQQGSDSSSAARRSGSGSGDGEPTHERAPHAKLANAERCRLLALLGWDMEVLSGSGGAHGGGGGITARPAPPQYSLIHLTGTPKLKGGARAGGNGSGASGSGASGSGTQRQPQPQPQHRAIPATNVVLVCRACRARAGLWSFGGGGGRPAPVGRVTSVPSGTAARMPPPPPQLHAPAAAAATPGSTPFKASPTLSLGFSLRAPQQAAAALSMTIAGGGFGGFGTSRTPGSPAPFGSPAAAAPVPVFGRAAMHGVAPSPAAIAAAAGAPPPGGNADAAGGALKRKASSGGGALSSGVEEAEPPASGAKRQRSASPSAAAAAAVPPSPSAVLAAAAPPPPLPFADAFDALSYHRCWCPWVYGDGVAAASGGGSGIAGKGEEEEDEGMVDADGGAASRTVVVPQPASTSTARGHPSGWLHLATTLSGAGPAQLAQAEASAAAADARAHTSTSMPSSLPGTPRGAAAVLRARGDVGGGGAAGSTPPAATDAPAGEAGDGGGGGSGGGGGAHTPRSGGGVRAMVQGIRDALRRS